jgi:hypothetical protein
VQRSDSGVENQQEPVAMKGGVRCAPPASAVSSPAAFAAGSRGKIEGASCYKSDRQ